MDKVSGQREVKVDTDDGDDEAEGKPEVCDNGV